MAQRSAVEKSPESDALHLLLTQRFEWHWMLEVQTAPSARSATHFLLSESQLALSTQELAFWLQSAPTSRRAMHFLVEKSQTALATQA